MIEPVGTNDSPFSPGAVEEYGLGKDAFFKLLIAELSNPSSIGSRITSASPTAKRSMISARGWRLSRN